MSAGTGACGVCLSAGRALRGLRCLAPLYAALLQAHLTEVSCESVLVCWECAAMLRRIAEFKRRAAFALHTLTCASVMPLSMSVVPVTDLRVSEFRLSSAYTERNDFDSTSVLTVSAIKNTYDYTYEHVEETEPECNAPFDYAGVKLEDAVKLEESEESKVELVLRCEGFDDDTNAGGSAEHGDALKLVEDEKPKFSEVSLPTMFRFRYQRDKAKETVRERVKKKHEPPRDVAKKPPKQRIKKQHRDSLLNVELLKEINNEVHTKYEKVRVSHEEVLRSRETCEDTVPSKRLQYKCDLCLIYFNTEDNLAQHKRCHEPHKGLASCDICHVTTILPNLLERHKEKHYLQYKCKECNYINTREDAVQKHVKSAHVKPIWKCYVCNKIFLTKGKLTYHQQIAHKERYECDYCKKSLSTRTSIMKHMKFVHTEITRLPCPICKKLYISKKNLRLHIGFVHEQSDELHVCADCNIMFKNVNQYQRHLKSNVHTGREYRFKCDECNKRFQSRSALKTHFEFRHLGKKPFKCEVCDKTFGSTQGMNSHVKMTHKGHQVPRVYMCEECGIAFKTKPTLNGHKLIHTGERPYKCDVCDDSFRQKSALYTHNRLKHLKQNCVKTKTKSNISARK